jgi:hypothetical protein
VTDWPAECRCRLRTRFLVSRAAKLPALNRTHAFLDNDHGDD